MWAQQPILKCSFLCLKKQVNNDDLSWLKYAFRVDQPFLENSTNQLRKQNIYCERGSKWFTTFNCNSFKYRWPWWRRCHQIAGIVPTLNQTLVWTAGSLQCLSTPRQMSTRWSHMIVHLLTINPSPSKFFLCDLNFHQLEVVSRYRETTTSSGWKLLIFV